VLRRDIDRLPGAERLQAIQAGCPAMLHALAPPPPPSPWCCQRARLMRPAAARPSQHHHCLSQALARMLLPQNLIASLQYNHSSGYLFNVSKRRSFARIVEQAAVILREALPIKCVAQDSTRHPPLSPVCWRVLHRPLSASPHTGGLCCARLCLLVPAATWQPYSCTRTGLQVHRSRVPGAGPHLWLAAAGEGARGVQEQG